MEAYAVVVAAFSLTMFYVVPSVFIVPVGVAVIELASEIVDFFCDYLEFSG